MERADFSQLHSLPPDAPQRAGRLDPGAPRRRRPGERPEHPRGGAPRARRRQRRRHDPGGRERQDPVCQRGVRAFLGLSAVADPAATRHPGRDDREEQYRALFHNAPVGLGVAENPLA